MKTSRSWTLFDLAAAPATPLEDTAGISCRPLVDNNDIGGSSLLGLKYEPGSGDHRRHAVGQVTLVIEGELWIDGCRCGPGAGCFSPGNRHYAIEAGPRGALAVEFRPAPIAYGRHDDDAVPVVKPPTAPQPTYGWETMQGAGPVSGAEDFTTFDIHVMPERKVDADISIQALVNHVEEDGQSLLSVRHGPDSVVPAHSHDVDQIVLILEGSITMGSRTFAPGTGFFTPSGKRYSLRTGERGALRVEWRPSPLRFSTEWVG